jgi:hypothetical protein
MATNFGASVARKVNVTGTGASITVIAANPRRKGLLIFNDSGVTANIDLSGGTASATSCSFNLGDQIVYEFPVNSNGEVYKGAITGLWASGDLRVTEME